MTDAYLPASTAAEPLKRSWWQPCMNCCIGATGKVMHAYGCPNDPAVFMAHIPAPEAIEITLKQASTRELLKELCLRIDPPTRKETP